MKKVLLASLAFFFTFNAISQNNAPVAVDDTVEIISQLPILIDVIANDYDPDGDSIYIEKIGIVNHGQIEIQDGVISYQSGHFTGTEYFSYRILDDGVPPLGISAGVVVNVLPNLHVPLANFENYNLLELEPVELELLSNDIDPDGDELKIRTASTYSGSVAFNADSSKVIFTPSFAVNYRTTLSYSVQERNTVDGFISNGSYAYIRILPNPDLPVLAPDTAYTTGGIPVVIPVLSNDYDPQGEAFEIFTNTYPGEGLLTQDGNNFIFTPYVSRKGPSEFSYSVREKYDPTIYTPETRVRINVLKNPDCPVGVEDFANGVTAQPVIIDVLANDYDPNGKSIDIYDIEAEGEASVLDHKIRYISNPLEVGQTKIYYRIKQIDNPDYYSEWTPVYLDLDTNPELPVAVDDYFTANIYFPVVVSPIANDIANSADSLILFISPFPTTKGKVEKLSDSLFSYQALTNATDHDTLEYYIRDKNDATLQALGKIIIDITGHHYYDSLVINKINAGVNADGLLFARVGQIPGQGIKSDYNPHFKYPPEKQISTIFNSMIWIGGKSSDDSLHFSGEYYRQMGADFQPGPISNAYDSGFAFRYWKLWKMNAVAIEYHQDHWQDIGYEPPEDIMTWPGNGQTSSGEASELAPYFDFNQDGIYNAMSGDYPLIRGDQCIFFMMNDDKEHTESYGNRLKTEIHGMAYAFDAPEDSALSHTIFVHYDIFNRSDKTYSDTYIAIRTDFDIGYWSDDFVGSDVSRSSYFGYNGDDIDNDYPTPYFDNEGYGENPPAQSVTLLGGPYMDGDGLDNPSGVCDFSVNGTNFGNGVSDDERYGLTGFFMRHNTIEQPTLPGFYNMMTGLWPDYTTLQFGGSGYPSMYDPLAVGPECRFMFPGDSDPVNFGTFCVPPNDPYNQDGFYWTDSSRNIPGDRNGLGSMGPFTFEPGDIQEIDVAYVVANGWDGPVSSVNKLMEYIDSLRYKVSLGEIIVPNDKLGIHEIDNQSGKLKIFPNPATDIINFAVEGINGKVCELKVYDVFGRMVISEQEENNELDISRLTPGFYVIRIKSDNNMCGGTFIKQ